MTGTGVVLHGNMVKKLVLLGQLDDDDKPFEMRSLANTTNERSLSTPAS